MKKILLLMAIAFSYGVHAQCDELFISEYVEGWSNNKALEIYNPTDRDIDLSNYRIDRYSNGSTSADANQKQVLTGVIRAKSVFVAVIDKRNPDGEGQEAPVWDELQAKANAFYGPEYDINNSLYFNGDDAVVLWNSQFNIAVDVFGRIGERPGPDGWNDVAPSFDSGKNGATGWTKDHSLIRKASVRSGDFDGLDPFNTGVEWDSIPPVIRDNEGRLRGNWNSLGFHESVCGNAVGINEVVANSISIYPQPSTQGSVTFRSAASIVSVNIMDVSGKTITALAPNKKTVDLNTTDLNSGYYIATIELSNGYRVSKKFVIEH